jgi:hypothetical protein
LARYIRRRDGSGEPVDGAFTATTLAGIRPELEVEIRRVDRFATLPAFFLFTAVGIP